MHFPQAFEEGISWLPQHADGVQDASTALKHEYEMLVRKGEFAAAVECVMSRLALGETLRADPNHLSFLYRTMIQRDAMRNVSELVATVPLDDEALRRIQTQLVMVDFQHQLVSVLIGERANFWHTMHHEMTSEGNLKWGSLETGRDPSRIFRMKDCAAGLSQFTDAVEAARADSISSSIELADSVEDRMRELSDLEQDVRVDYIATFNHGLASKSRVFPPFHLARDETAIRNVVLAQLAVCRYFRRNGRLPINLESIDADLISEPLSDPFDGQLLRHQVSDGMTTVYSIGADRWDAGATGSLEYGTPDLVNRFTIPQK